jgi:hypothetical protein
MARALRVIGWVAVGLAGCGSDHLARRPDPLVIPPPSAVEADPPPAPSARRGAPPQRPSTRRPEIVRRAAALVGVPLRQVSRSVPDDCTGFVRLAYQHAGIDLMEHGSLPSENGVTAIHRGARAKGALHRRRPRPGDLVFFRETYDRNRDGRRNDGLTHIGIVESVDPRGTVTFFHRGSQGVARARLNLLHPTKRTWKDGAVVNDYIRRKSARSRAYLTGELFSGFASPDKL